MLGRFFWFNGCYCTQRAESRFLLDQLLRVFLIRSGGRRGRIRCGVDDRGRTLVLVLCAPLLVVGDGFAAVVINLQEVKLLDQKKNDNVDIAERDR